MRCPYVAEVTVHTHLNPTWFCFYAMIIVKQYVCVCARAHACVYMCVCIFLISCAQWLLTQELRPAWRLHADEM